MRDQGKTGDAAHIDGADPAHARGEESAQPNRAGKARIARDVAAAPRGKPSRKPADGAAKTPSPPRPPDNKGRPRATPIKKRSSESSAGAGLSRQPASMTRSVWAVIGTPKGKSHPGHEAKHGDQGREQGDLGHRLGAARGRHAPEAYHRPRPADKASPTRSAVPSAEWRAAPECGRLPPGRFGRERLRRGAAIGERTPQ